MNERDGSDASNAQISARHASGGADSRWEVVEEGAELLQIGETDQAIETLTRAVQEHSDNELAFFFLGNAYYEQQDYARALKSFLRAIELMPDYLGALISAGHTLRMMGESNKALAIGQRALAVKSDDPDVVYLLGLLHFTRGEHTLAHAFLTRFLTMNPELEVALEARGMLDAIEQSAVP